MSSSETPFGARLRDAREASGVSLREISASTKISKAALEALERDNIGHLPGGIFTRSFVRTYAAAVGLDPEATLRDFQTRFPDDGDRDPTLGRPEAHPSAHDEFQSYQQMARTVLGLAVLSIPLIVFLVVAGMPGGDEAAEASLEVEPAPVVVTSRPPPAAPPARPPLPAVTRAAAVGPLTMDIHPRADCWVSATVDGERRFSRIMRVGDREVLEADRELVVNVGDAGAFVFAINQRPGRSLGTSGEVVTVRITRENYRSFVIE